MSGRYVYTSAPRPMAIAARPIKPPFLEFAFEEFAKALTMYAITLFTPA